MYSLIGVDGNAFAIMGYYNNLICVCDSYIDIANESLSEQEVE